MLCTKYNDFLRMVIYQIYPRSFFDTNGDGIGDLNGVIAKLDYIKSLGANAIWLCPCFKSPNEDNGYDVSDYTDIMDEFGTMEDMDRLVEEMHSRGMKLILDLVPNHTATQHRWFQESRKGKDNPYSDFYYWFDEKPNEWQSAFKGSAWEYDELRGQYYLHTFAVGQADLNWDNPAVVKAMQDVVDFWVDKGVDGFRIDVVDCISKDIKNDKNDMGPHLHEYLRAVFGREKTAHLFTVGESIVQNIDEMINHCAAERKELSTLFVFDHMECGRANKFTPKKDSLKTLRDILVRWQDDTAKNDLIYSLFLENHDQPQMISRIGNDRELRYESATDIATMLYLMKGVPFIYQGQEIGMPFSPIDSMEEVDDIETVGNYKEMCKKMSEDEALAKASFGSRDNARHPIAWDSSDNGGFTSGTPWLCMHKRWKEVNVANDLNSDRSVYRYYQAMLKLRAENEAFLSGTFSVLSSPEDDYLIYKRTLGKEEWLVVCNFEKAQKIEPDLYIADGRVCDKPVLANLGRDSISGIYTPYECAVSKVLFVD